MIHLIYFICECGFIYCIWGLPFWKFLGAIAFGYFMEKLREWAVEYNARGRGTPEKSV